MISHTVFRGMNNEIILQLLSAGDPLGQPDSIDTVRLGIGDLLLESAEDSDIEYDDSDGTLHLKLGRVADVVALLDGNYQVEVSAYGTPDNEEGIAFGAFLIYLRNWSGELGS